MHLCAFIPVFPLLRAILNVKEHMWTLSDLYTVLYIQNDVNHFWYERFSSFLQVYANETERESIIAFDLSQSDITYIINYSLPKLYNGIIIDVLLKHSKKTSFIVSPMNPLQHDHSRPIENANNANNDNNGDNGNNDNDDINGNDNDNNPIDTAPNQVFGEDPYIVQYNNEKEKEEEEDKNKNENDDDSNNGNDNEISDISVKMEPQNIELAWNDDNLQWLSYRNHFLDKYILFPYIYNPTRLHLTTDPRHSLKVTFEQTALDNCKEFYQDNQVWNICTHWHVSVSSILLAVAVALLYYIMLAYWFRTAHNTFSKPGIFFSEIVFVLLLACWFYWNGIRPYRDDRYFIQYKSWWWWFDPNLFQYIDNLKKIGNEERRTEDEMSVLITQALMSASTRYVQIFLSQKVLFSCFNQFHDCLLPPFAIQLIVEYSSADDFIGQIIQPFYEDIKQVLFLIGKREGIMNKLTKLTELNKQLKKKKEQIDNGMLLEYNVKKLHAKAEQHMSKTFAKQWSKDACCFSIVFEVVKHF
ncbi:hypothetical protein RFI_15402 [Reticulomyxa filosa]|uniref:Uncharacterized protein n=1 Tax=Reticulomyxa filosa TaxID=46433 RepID=X6N6Y0_RETFI|nr:hypothetical protein RFI_15402 [Reticulomyxa filosa]|eukprot:ETO21796.1 hypothetical protein RFI_15402 [Reticulomyxa filosa]